MTRSGAGADPATITQVQGARISGQAQFIAALYPRMYYSVGNARTRSRQFRGHSVNAGSGCLIFVDTYRLKKVS